MALEDAALWLGSLTLPERQRTLDWIRKEFPGGGRFDLLVEQAMLHMPPEVIGKSRQCVPGHEKRLAEFSKRELQRFKEEHGYAKAGNLIQEQG